LKDKVKIYKGQAAYLGKRSEEAGFIGEVDRMFNFYTQTLIRPGTKARDAIRSLELVIRDLELRAEAEEAEEAKGKDIIPKKGELVFPKKSSEVSSFAHAIIDLDLNAWVEKRRPGYTPDWFMVKPYGKGQFQITRIGVKPKHH
jgi:hypothetical protein